MKKYILILLIISISIFIGFIFINFNNQSQYINIEKDNLMWNLYDMNVQIIQTNMSTITIASDTFEWDSFNELNISDEAYKKILNELLVKTRTWYLTLEYDKRYYTDTNYAKKYRNNESIKKEELHNLKNTLKNNHIENFKYYKDIELNIEKDNKEKFLNKIDEIIDYNNKYYINNPKNYNEFIYNEIVETEIIKNISEFLKSEYNRLK